MKQTENSIFILKCAVVSLLLHLLLFVVFIAIWILGRVEGGHVPIVKEKKEEQVVVFQMPTVENIDETVETTAKKLEEKAITDSELEIFKKELESRKPNTTVILPSLRYEQTVSSQKSDKPIPETNLIGAINTLATSNDKPTQDAFDTPAVKGDVTPAKNSLVNSDFKNGTLDQDDGSVTQITTGVESGVDQGDLVDNSIKNKPNYSEDKVRSLENPQAVSEKQDDVLDFEKKISRTENPQQENKQTHEGSQTAKIEAAKSTEDIAPSNIEKKAKKGQSDQSKDPFAVALGLTSESKRSGRKGSVSNTGTTASKNVRATALGKYQRSIMRAVEKKWNALCRKYADRLLPGQLTMKFLVNTNGKVVDVISINENAGSEFQKGITLKAIQQAVIPSMPKKLKTELRNSPVPVTINFNF